jgi:hypothetical protein
VQSEAGTGDERLRLVCECALADCDSGIEVSASRFDALRRDDQRYLVLPGHVLHEVEHEIDSGDGWVIVEKHGAAAVAAGQEARS